MIGTEKTRAEKLIDRLGWNAKASGTDHRVIQVCPFCDNTNFKFYIHVGGDKDGMFDCKVCGAVGNFYQLLEKLGLRIANSSSVKDAAEAKSSPSPLPDFKALHSRLLNDVGMSDVLDHLVAERKFSMDVIQRYMIGAQEYDGRKWFVIPYFDKAGIPVYFKARTIPPYKKDFKGPSGREARLFNEATLVPGLAEVILCEGEPDCLALLSAGYEYVVGIPGANVKKASWLEILDRIAPDNIYILYDNDKVGQTAAKDMAVRIGIDKVKNILLPDFGGKDVNDWFKAGRSLDELLDLRDAAKPFDVEGVYNVVDVIDTLRAELVEKGNKAKYDTPWPSLTARVGGFEDGDLVGVMAEGKVGKTTAALNMLSYYTTQGEVSFMHCEEMLPVRLVRKWVSHVTNTDDTPGKSQITPEVIDEALEIARNMPGDLLFGYTRSTKPTDVFNTIRQAVRRYGVKVVCFDNLQLLVRNIEHSQQETSVITKQFKALAMELGILIFLIIQPHRVAEGQIISARNAMGSSAIEKDVDFMICLHRNRVAKIKATEFVGALETDDNFEPQLYVRVDLARFAPGGVCTLWMDGATSTVREIGEGDLTVLEPQKVSGIIPIEGDAPPFDV